MLLAWSRGWVAAVGPPVDGSAETPDVNVTARPAAGVLGVMALPISGAWKSLRRSVGGAPQKELAKARRDMTEEMASRVQSGDRQVILDKFAELEKGTAARKEQMRKKAKLFLTGDEKAFEAEMGLDDRDAGAPEPKSKGKQSTPQQQSNAGVDGQTEVQATSTEMLKGEIMQGVQAQIAVQPEKASELEEAEKRGYERAMAEMRKREKEGGGS